MSNSQTANGTIKLSQDIGRLLNNHQGSDVQFKIGGATKSTGETIYDSSAAVTMHAHSLILRCRSRHFAAMFENDKEWRERSGGVIHKPDISSSVFYKILDYIYTGDLHVKVDDLFEVMVAAEEMELGELSIKCQSDIMKILQQSFSTKEENNNDEIKETEELNQQHFSVDFAVRTLLLPALTFAHNHAMMDLSQNIVSFTVNHIEIILSLGDARIAFFENIPTQILQEIIASDALQIQEHYIWDLALSWACFKAKVLKSTVEAHFKLGNNNDHEYDIISESPSIVTNEGDNFEQQTLLSNEQLRQLKATLTPILPIIRFSLIDDDQYLRIVNVLRYFLPTRRMHDLNKFRQQSDRSRPLDIPRRNEMLEEALNTKKQKNLKTLSKIIDNAETWQQLKTWIFESHGIFNIYSVEDVNLKLLFRASEHWFSAKAFHEYCDHKGPTLVIVNSNEGYLFGGVNFYSWKSDGTSSGTASNFVFSLADCRHRNTSTKFSLNSSYGTYNYSSQGPVFDAGIQISDDANIINSWSNFPHRYNRDEASNIKLAGSEYFLVADYEVFAIYTAQNS